MTGIKVLALFAFVCTLQAVYAHFDLGEYIGERIMDTIKTEKLDCSNYADFCEKKKNEFIENDKRTEKISDIVGDFCTSVLSELLCKKNSGDETNDVNGPVSPLDIINENLEHVNEKKY